MKSAWLSWRNWWGFLNLKWFLFKFILKVKIISFKIPNFVILTFKAFLFSTRSANRTCAKWRQRRTRSWRWWRRRLTKCRSASRRCSPRMWSWRRRFGLLSNFSELYWIFSHLNHKIWTKDIPNKYGEIGKH